MPQFDTGNTGFMLLATSLVMLMTPGLAFFYGGLVRSKNVLGTIMQSFILVALISIQWVLWGYSLAFGPDHAGIVGGQRLVVLGVHAGVQPRRRQGPEGSRDAVRADHARRIRPSRLRPRKPGQSARLSVAGEVSVGC